ncbi:hypothetical protein B649_08460 [Candidatus Sulfuricurvum sp. RIFRC-1]|uniref:DUF6044 family protein n=1 Tax=Candidatus Sulfuricurvum sp. RIFRC-1 TaxID=1249480 RepID=UPI0002995D51|nr:DUF6044 family protein [Candidatus Sulfuricurvum sp. RIFRC-1]AFV98004.1 hypothetical protein B649_08460 [Candidatus Sulfuricurvum sp. RIFRC-1]
MNKLGFLHLISSMKFHIVSLLVIILYIAPWFIFGEDAYMRIGDHLDSNVIWHKILIDNNLIFASSSTIINTMMNGIPRIAFGNELDMVLWLNVWFGVVYAHAINQLLMRVVAYVGMFFLLKKYIIVDQLSTANKIIIHGVALSFALLPFWPSAGLSVAGLPLVLFAFLNIYKNRDTWIEWLIIAFIPFYSSLVLVHFFFLLLAFSFFIYDLIQTRTLHRKLFFAITFLTFISLIINYRLVFGMLLPSDFVSHRSEMSIAKAMNGDVNNIYLYLKSISTYLVYGHHAHVETFHTYFIGLSLFLATMITLKKWDKDYLLILKLIILLIIFSFILKLWYYPPFDYVKEQVLLFKEFNMSRIAWLNPMLWYIVFALALSIIARYFKYSIYIVSILLLLQIGYLFSKSDYYVGQKADQPSFQEFYSPELFYDIKTYLNYDANKSTVACLGFFPAVAQYNGMQTIGGYSANYPLSYKYEFRKIIEKTLSSNSDLKKEFDYWGSNCYLQVSQLKSVYMGNKPEAKIINVSELNFQQMKKLSVTYLLSAYELEKNPEIRLLKVFQNKEYFWKIYVYEI